MPFWPCLFKCHKDSGWHFTVGFVKKLFFHCLCMKLILFLFSRRLNQRPSATSTTTATTTATLSSALITTRAAPSGSATAATSTAKQTLMKKYESILALRQDGLSTTIPHSEKYNSVAKYLVNVVLNCFTLYSMLKNIWHLQKCFQNLVNYIFRWWLQCPLAAIWS